MAPTTKPWNLNSFPTISALTLTPFPKKHEAQPSKPTPSTQLQARGHQDRKVAPMQRRGPNALPTIPAISQKRLASHDPKPAAPSPFAKALSYMENYLAKTPESSSSYAAAQCIVPHFFEEFSKYISDPHSVRAQAFVENFRAEIFNVLQSKAAGTYDAEKQQNGAQRGKYEVPGYLIAVYLAYRVEAGLTSTPLDKELMEYLV